ncbi:tripartite tricarboxylate transporter substrate binding protein [Pantoea sp. 18069]|uniref:Bug family tripartite tricarboxylate transporter substrate binding protein n=1 Tax=Pantoea sp. 18069 TaxID=2681415 RepID=UPI001358F95B|nr:tripartite tricarboxylate transporter substrate-binding protein [Pantoea sp. 18069]
MKKRMALALMICTGLLAALPAARAADFPTQPLRWLVPYPAGGGSDFMARVVAQPLGLELQQSVAIENKPGGNGAVAVADLLRAAPDGHTLLNVDNGTLVFNAALYKNLSYAPARDLALVTLLARTPMILLAGPGSQARNVQAFFAEARRGPGRLSYGSAGAGSPQHLAMELLKKQAGLSMTHVPYRGSAPALSDLVGGQIPAVMSDYAPASGFLKTGKLRALAVADTRRHPLLPDVPTFEELGLAEMQATALIGVAVRATTPADTVAALQQAIAAALQRPEVHARYTDLGLEPVAGTPQAFEELVRAETARWHPLIRSQRIALE